MIKDRISHFSKKEASLLINIIEAIFNNRTDEMKKRLEAKENEAS